MSKDNPDERALYVRLTRAEHQLIAVAAGLSDMSIALFVASVLLPHAQKIVDTQKDSDEPRQS